MDQHYADETLKTLNLIQDVILDDEDTKEYSGYLAEMGGTPQKLEHLWINPDPQGRVFGKKEAKDDSGVELYCGWRGPYVQLPIGQDTLLDGWGNEFEVLDRNGDIPKVGKPFEIVRSLGADRKDGGFGGYNSDIACVLAATKEAVLKKEGVSVPQDLCISQIDVVIRWDKGKEELLEPSPFNGKISIRYYHPDPQTGEIAFDETILRPPFVAETFERSIKATVGPRAIRVTQSNGVVHYESENTLFKCASWKSKW